MNVKAMLTKGTNINFTAKGALRGARQVLPLALSVFAYGSVYGVLARQTGMTLWEAATMSASVYAGSSQLIVLDLWQTPLAILTIILTTLIVNLRHLLMGASLTPWFSELSPFKKYLSAFFLVDENYALTMGEFRDGGTDTAFLLGSGGVLYVTWCLATISGYVLGAVVQDPALWGLDFAFLAVFLALLTGLWSGKQDLLPWGVAAVVAVIGAQWLPGKWYILTGGLAGSLTGAWRAD